jgi:hypothetical protein
MTYGSLYSELKKDVNGKYVPEFRFATSNQQQFRMFLTGANSAASVMRCEVSYWPNLHSVLDRQTDMKYFLKNRQYVAVSYDETFFVLRNDTGFY